MVAQLPLCAIVPAALLYRFGSRRPVAGSRARARRERAAAYYAGLVALTLALEPPLDSLAEKLFWAHMVQHLLLQLIAPPLLLLGAPWMPLWRVLPLSTRRRLGRWIVTGRTASWLRSTSRILTLPLISWLLFVGAIALSHLPVVFDLALRNRAFHETEHALFVVLGLLFWSRVLDSPPFRAPVRSAGRVGFLAAATLSEWLLGIVLLAIDHPIYAAYGQLLPRPEHLSPLADQQFGAGIMFDPFSPLAFATLWAIKGWVSEASPRSATQLSG